MSTPGIWAMALSGMTGAFLGQKMDALKALAFGVFLHGYAADRVAMRYRQGRDISSATCSRSFPSD